MANTKVKIDQRKDNFNKIKKIMIQKRKGLYLKDNFESRLEIYGNGKYTAVSKKTGKSKEMTDPYFAGLIIQSKYVGFYLMAPYMFPKEFDRRFPILQKTLKGKSCFRIKKLTPELLNDIKKCLDWAHKVYKSKGMVL